MAERKCKSVSQSCNRTVGVPAGRTTSYERRDRLGQRPFSQGFQGNINPSTVCGLDRLASAQLNQGTAFTLQERQLLGIQGLLPPRFKSQEEQLELCMRVVERHEDNLSKYVYLMSLLDRNERLFYRLLTENVETMMPIVYTPTVGLACQKYGLIYRRQRGMFISIYDRGHVYEVLRNWPEPDVRAIVVTDGERILGLGDLGAYGMGIPVGKLALYTALAGIPPYQCLPITLDVGTNTQSLLDDPYYIGLRHERVVGPEYDDFLDEFMEAVVRRFGQSTLIQFEDFGNHNAFGCLAKYAPRYCTFNDDIQGTAAVGLAGILASLRVTETRLSDNTILFLGAGEAALGIADLCVMAMAAEGTSEPDARARVWLVDIDGLLVKDRLEGGLSGHKLNYAKDHPPNKDLEAIVREVKPTVLIGASTASGAFTPQILKDMAALNKRPVIFALSNPTAKAECTAEDAYAHTDGACLFASGSPFPPVTYKGKQYRTGQGNNAYIFPGMALGVITAGIQPVTDDFFLQAAQVVASTVSEADLEMGSLYPPLTSIQQCSLKIATRVSEYAYERGLASVHPEPVDKEEFIKGQLYDYSYSVAFPTTYSWPENVQ